MKNWMTCVLLCGKKRITIKKENHFMLKLRFHPERRNFTPLTFHIEQKSTSSYLVAEKP